MVETEPLSVSAIGVGVNVKNQKNQSKITKARYYVPHRRIPSIFSVQTRTVTVGY